MKTRKQIFTLAVFALFLFALMSPRVMAQSDESTATLDETETWLKNFLTARGTFIVTSKDQPTSFLKSEISEFKILDRCTIGFNYIQSLGDTRYPKNDFGQAILVKKLLFADLDPLGIKIEKSDNIFNGEYEFINMTIATSSHEPKIIINGDNHKGDYIVITIKDKESAERIVKGLKHAIKLCGGKVDPF